MGSAHRAAVFLDLNGTLVLPLLVERPTQLQPIEGAAAAVTRLSAAGFLCPIVTIQSRIGKGLFTRTEFDGWFREFAADFAARGAHIVGPYVCPHRFRDDCPCKKPKPLLYEQAARDHGIDMTRSFVIGDSAADVEAAARIGGRGCLVRTGYGEQDSEVERALPYAAVVADTLTKAVDWILTAHARQRAI